METSILDLLQTSNSQSEKSTWNYKEIYKANICNCKEKFSEPDFLALKASSDIKKSIRRLLRKQFDKFNENFLASKNDAEKLQLAQNLKLLTDSLGGKDRINVKIWAYLLSFENKTEKEIPAKTEKEKPAKK